MGQSSCLWVYRGSTGGLCCTDGQSELHTGTGRLTKLHQGGQTDRQTNRGYMGQWTHTSTVHQLKGGGVLEWATNWIEPAASFNNDDLYQLTRGQSTATTYMTLYSQQILVITIIMAGVGSCTIPLVMLPFNTHRLHINFNFNTYALVHPPFIITARQTLLYSSFCKLFEVYCMKSCHENNFDLICVIYLHTASFFELIIINIRSHPFICINSALASS